MLREGEMRSDIAARAKEEITTIIATNYKNETKASESKRLVYGAKSQNRSETVQIGDGKGLGTNLTPNPMGVAIPSSSYCKLPET